MLESHTTQLVSYLQGLWSRIGVRRALTSLPLVLLLGACGGGGDSTPAQWPQQTVDGVVVNAGQAMVNAKVYIYCGDGESGHRLFYATTDSNGAYSKAVNTAVAPCVMYAQSADNSSSVYSYISAFRSSKVTAHITSLTDAMLSLVMGTDDRGIFLNSMASGIAKLGAQISQGADVAAWTALRQQLLSGPYFSDPVNVNAMTGDPLSGTLQVSSGTAPAGYFNLLQTLASNGVRGTQLWAYASPNAQKISGNVVLNGQIASQSPMYLACKSPIGMSVYNIKTDTNGAFSTVVTENSSLCMSAAYSSQTGIWWFSYAKGFGNGPVTSNITALTDTMLSLLLNSSNLPTMVNLNGFAQLQTQLDQGQDAVLWSTFRQQLISGTYFSAPADVNAMAGEPVSSPLPTTTVNPPPAGYFSLLQKIAPYTQAQLVAIAKGVWYTIVPGSNGAEVLDATTGLVWQRCVLGMVWSGTNCTGSPSLLLWNNVQAAVANASPSSVSGALPWRLPTRYELPELLSVNGGVDPVMFPSSPGDWTWTSSMPLDIAYAARVVNTKGGTRGVGELTDQLLVRLVREDTSLVGQPTQQMVTGTVVNAGKAMANAQVHILCNERLGNVREYYTTTDSNGGFKQAVSTASAPCILQATPSDHSVGLYSYVKNFNNASVTAHITPITDAILKLTFGTSKLEVLLGNPSSKQRQANNLNFLRTQLDQGVDTAYWNSLSQELRSGSYFSDPININAMGDPVTGFLQVTVGAPPAGYFSLLQKVAAQGIASPRLQVLANGGQYKAVAGTNGAEVQDLLSGLVWQRCALGMVWSGTACTGTPSVLLWSDLQTAVSKATRSTVSGSTAWRLAGYHELKNLLTTSSTGGANGLDATWFPGSPVGATWTSTLISNYPPYVSYTIDMQTGDFGYGTGTDRFVARLVR